MNAKVLIIEDDTSIAQLQRDYLEINGFTVELVNDGQSGLNLALKQEFDLIIVDVMLPGLDGFEICRQIRQQKQTPIMIVSAKKEDIDKVRGLGLGANDYLSKPFSPNELVARVKAHITRYRSVTTAVSAPVLENKELKIELAAHKVFVLEKEITLTTKEYQLLVFLMQHPNRVWQKEQLFEQVWGMDSLDTEVSTVVVHIKRIRAKLRQAGLNEGPIETLWGSGYRFNKEV